MRQLLTAMLLLAVTVSAMAIEEPRYDVVAETDAYEIRRYAPYIVAEVDVEGDFEDAGNQAFRILADYIFGNNTTGEKMAMTAPVTSAADDGVRMSMTAPVESRAARGGRFTYAFVMERKYTMESLPRPLDERIRVVTRPARTMAVHRYSGTWSERRYVEHRDALLVALERDGTEVAGSPVWARYDAPFVPWFLRRNEVMVEIESGR